MSRAAATAPQRLTGGACVALVVRSYPLTLTRSQTTQDAPQAETGGTGCGASTHRAPCPQRAHRSPTGSRAGRWVQQIPIE